MTTETRTCPYCEEPAILREGTTRYRRGERVVAVTTHYWECPSNCTGPDGERPFRFEDQRIGKANAEAAEDAWRARFGEPMPPPGKPGRKTKAPRTRRVPVLMSDDELQLLDRLRGRMSRGAYLRRAMKRAISETERTAKS